MSISPPARAALVTAALALAACGGAATTTTPGTDVEPALEQPSDEVTSNEESDPVAAGDDAGPGGSVATDVAAPASLAWSGTDLDGALVEGAELAGEDLVLWIWAPWCSICNREAPSVAEVARARGDDVRFVGVAGRDDLAAHRGFVDEHGLSFFDHVADPDGTVWAHYGVGYQPAFVFIDDDGTLIDVHAGAMSPDDLQAAIDELVAA